MPLNHEDIFEHEGRRFRVYIERDDNNEPPWDRNDGHGPVRNVRSCYGDRPNKRPGERIIFNCGRGDYYLYDWQEACRLACRDGWNAEPYDAPNRIERAVQADFDFLRSWLNDEWHYVGVCVALVDGDDKDITNKYENAIWGIESNAGDYLEETARELAEQVVPPPPSTEERYREVLEFAAQHLSSDWPERCQDIVRKARDVLNATKEKTC